MCALKAGTRNPLFKKYSELSGKIPWVGFGDFPTHVARMKKLGKELGASDLWVKREDLSGKSYGGNKVRKLEFSLADARLRKKKHVLTFGGIGSNHVLATTIYASRLGMNTSAVLIYQPPSEHVRQNLRAYAHYGTKVYYLQSSLDLPKILASYPKAWIRKTYLLPPGGSNTSGAFGFIGAAFEIAEQVEAGEMPMPEYIYLAGGSGGTAAGLLLGAKLCGLPSQIKIVRVADPHMVNETIISIMANRAARLLRRMEPSIPEVSVKPGEVDLMKGFIGEGYGHSTAEAEAAIGLMENTEGLHLEVTYTAKAVAAMIRNIPYHPDAPTLYLHTLNSADIYSSIPEDLDLSALPEPLRKIAEGSSS